MKKTILKFFALLLTLCTLTTTGLSAAFTVNAAAPDAEAAADAAASGDATSGEAEEEEITAETFLKKYTYSSVDEKLATMELVLDASETFGYKLYAMEMTGEVAVEDVKTGQILFTNPYDAGKASNQAETLNELFSQLSVTYKDNANKVSTMFSYQDAAMQDQIRMHLVKNGIRMDYTIGRGDARRLCPLSIEKSRYEEVLLAYIEDANDAKKFRSYYTLYDPFNEESEAVKQSWLDQYPITSEMAIYVMAESSTNYEKNKVESIIRAWCPHYTFEDMQSDHEMTKFVASSEVMPVFKMSLEYKLDKDGLTVRLPANSVSFNEDYYTLNSISILPYFGAGSDDYTGYTFVPDGSGSIIRFEDIKGTRYLFTGDMYGPDYSYQTLPTSFTGKAEVMRLPVFGLVENRGYFYKLDEQGNKTDEVYCAHNNKEMIEAVPHTCTEMGYTKYTCLGCGEEIIEYKVNGKEDPAAHTFDDSQNIVTPPTCTEQGYTTKTCTICGEVVVEDYKVAAHVYTTKVVEAGCEGDERGYTLHTCSVCGDVFMDNYTDPGHNYVEIPVEGVTVKSDCKTGTGGHAVFECTKCGDRYDTDTYPTHDWTYTKTNKTHKYGNTEYPIVDMKCKICGKTAVTVDHNSTISIEKNPNYEHTLIGSSKEVIAEASCKTYGYVKGVCRVCGDLSGEVEIITPPSHTFTNEVKMPTCTEGGYTEQTCSECGYTVRIRYTEPSHSYVDTVVAPTCDSCGYTVHTCSVCGDSYIDKWTSAGHDWDLGVTDIDGNTIYTCYDCFATTTNGAYAEATRHRGEKIESEQPLPKEEDFIGMEAPPVGTDGTSGEVSGDAASGAVSGDVTSGDAASGAVSGDAASGGAASGDAASGGAASGDAASDATSGDTGRLESDLTVPDGAYVKYIQRGFLAIVEDGESLSTVTSSHGGALHKYNSVYLSVNPRPSDEYNLADSLSVGEDAPWTVVSKRKYTGGYKLRFIMIGEGTGYDATYSGMANAYREYLKKTGVLTPVTPDSRGIPLTMTMNGLTSEEVSFLGIPYWTDRAMTTFEDLKAITEDLAGEGITNLNYTLYSWTEEADMPDNLEYRKVVGGDDGYKDFVNYAKEKNIGLYPEFSFNYGWNTDLFNGIRLSKHAVKTIDDRYIAKRTYNPVLQILSFGDDDQALGRAMSASAFDYFYSLISGDLADFGYLGIAPRNLGSDVNSDFDEDEPYNREDSKEFIAEVLAKMKEDSGDHVLLSGGNAYVLPYVRNLVDVALEGSNYLNTSASVPFTGMVLHGYVNYSGGYTNEASDSRRETLKMIENGAYPYFFLAKQNTKLIVGSDYYSISYDSWREDMITIYKTVNEALKDLQATEFVNHELLVGERVPDEDEVARDKAEGEEAIAKAEENVEKTRTAYVNAVNLYKRLIAEGNAVYAEKLYVNAALNTPKAYKEALAALETAKATYGERTSDYDKDGNYITTRYTVDDGSIVRVTYANGVSYLLNYNNFAVKVTVNGQFVTIPAFEYVKA